MSNAAYWADRFTALDDLTFKQSEKYARNLQKQFDMASKSISRDIGYWYGRLAENNDISYAAAKKLLKDDELSEFHMTVEEYIKHGKEDGLDPEWIKKLENASAKVHISRLEQIQTDMQQTIEGLYNQYETGAEALLESVTTTSYYHTAYEIAKGTGVGVNLHRLDKDTVAGFLSRPWCQDGRVFSDRIWTRKDELIDTLNTVLAQNLMTGADPQKAIDQIAKQFDVDKRAAGRLVMTETAAISSEARQKCMKDLDVEEFEVVATLDSRTSPICRAMDGQHFPMSQYKVGLNAPPFHCNCRTTTAPWFDDEFTQDETRAAREPGDTGYNRVPSNMTYKEWEDEFLSEAESREGEQEKSHKNIDRNYAMNNGIIGSAGYKRRIEALNESREVTDTIWQETVNAIKHRSGTEFEDLIFVDSNTGEVKISNQFEKKRRSKPTKAMKTMLRDAKPNTIIAIHNHPGSTTPSIDDIEAAVQRKYKYGIVACHNGNIFKYTIVGEVNSVNTNIELDILNKLIYNSIEPDVEIKTEKCLERLLEAGVKLEVL